MKNSLGARQTAGRHLGVCAAHLAGVDGTVLGPGHDKSLTANVEAVGKGLVLGTRLVGNDIGDVLHLVGGDLCGRV